MCPSVARVRAACSSSSSGIVDDLERHPCVGAASSTSPGVDPGLRPPPLQHRLEPLHVLGRPAEAELRVGKADSAGEPSLRAPSPRPRCRPRRRRLPVPEALLAVHEEDGGPRRTDHVPGLRPEALPGQPVGPAVPGNSGFIRACASSTIETKNELSLQRRPLRLLPGLRDVLAPRLRRQGFAPGAASCTAPPIASSPARTGSLASRHPPRQSCPPRSRRGSPSSSAETPRSSSGRRSRPGIASIRDEGRPEPRGDHRLPRTRRPFDDDDDLALLRIELLAAPPGRARGRARIPGAARPGERTGSTRGPRSASPSEGRSPGPAGTSPARTGSRSRRRASSGAADRNSGSPVSTSRRRSAKTGNAVVSAACGAAV